MCDAFNFIADALNLTKNLRKKIVKKKKTPSKHDVSVTHVVTRRQHKKTNKTRKFIITALKVILKIYMNIWEGFLFHRINQLQNTSSYNFLRTCTWLTITFSSFLITASLLYFWIMLEKCLINLWGEHKHNKTLCFS